MGDVYAENEIVQNNLYIRHERDDGRNHAAFKKN